ncbi:hypothetical protein Lal_00024597 [Lupinus albus]|uniref:Putative mitogen-activated protein kinase kinase kinase STE-STE11 family n=1 Tax=Lupinus albus TaxID=3870 RepID=A0A6A5NN48_LUPAL|nr:putative mitogen-activated protein kinase kinase kinase STE-STE11 family [Lupinus albus]KAF1889274.1 hypothetical protein Lal_00024597 [Lupinus albus]
MASWVRGKCIGKGAFGTVNIGVTKSNGQVFAVKSVDRKIGLPGQIAALENEIKILRRMVSPHVVNFLGDDITCEATTSYRNLHLEYLPGGTVADMDHDDMDELLVRRYAWCLVHALRHVHEHGVVHCDVKGSNVLLAGDGCVAKLADFGSAVEFDHSAKVVPRGSPMWMAPEVIRREYQGPESDVWSLGCTVIEMITGKPPWEDNGVDTLRQIGFSGEVPEFPSALSELGRDFLEKCLRREIRERWSCDQLLQHPYLVIDSPIKVTESSPRCVMDWFESEFTESEDEEIEFYSENSAKGRIGKLATGLRANWETEGWVEVRAELSCEAEASTTTTTGVCELEEEEIRLDWEIENVTRVEEEMEVGSSLEYSDSERSGTAKNERVKREIRRNGRLVWRCECDECNRNRNRRIGCGCRYGHKLDSIKGISNIYSLPCKLIKSMKSYYLFEYAPFFQLFSVAYLLI